MLSLSTTFLTLQPKTHTFKDPLSVYPMVGKVDPCPGVIVLVIWVLAGKCFKYHVYSFWCTLLMILSGLLGVDTLSVPIHLVALPVVLGCHLYFGFQWELIYADARQLCRKVVRWLSGVVWFCMCCLLGSWRWWLQSFYVSSIDCQVSWITLA